MRLFGADFDRLLDCLEQPAALCTLDTRVLIVNPAFEKAFGGELDASRPLVEDDTVRDALSGGRIWQGPSELADVATLVPLRSAEGDVAGCLALLPDARAAREHVRLRAQLEQMRRATSLGQLASGIAHDFNNMLAVILNYVGLAERLAESGADPSDALGHIRDAAERSADITQQLLALSRGPAGKAEAIDVNAAVSSLGPILVSTLGDSIEYRAELDEHVWPTRLARTQLQRILLNLAANARDVMPDGGTFSVATANVQVDAELASRYEDLAPGRYVQLEVRDTGSGMPEDVAAHAFEPFFTTKEVGAGTGLGLSIIRGIIKQAGGHISVWSREGRGTRFSLYLPTESAADAAESGQRLAERRRILVVDDEGPLRRAVARMLAESGYDVVSATDGIDALELLELQDEPIDLVLTDVLMPRMSGVELASRLAVSHPFASIVLMSGYAHGLISQGGLDPDELLFLQKPFAKAELVERLETAWARAAAARQPGAPRK